MKNAILLLVAPRRKTSKLILKFGNKEKLYQHLIELIDYNVMECILPKNHLNE